MYRFALKATRNSVWAYPPCGKNRISLQRGKRRRLDQLCAEQFPEYSLNLMQSWILQGKVLVNSRPVLKPGTQVLPSAAIKLKATVPKFVCR